VAIAQRARLCRVPAHVHAREGDERLVQQTARLGAAAGGQVQPGFYRLRDRMFMG